MIPVIIRPYKKDEKIFRIHVGEESYAHQIEEIFKFSYTVRRETYEGHGFFMSSMHKNTSQAYAGALSTIFMQGQYDFDEQGVIVVYQHKLGDVLIERETIIENGVGYNWKLSYEGKTLRASSLLSAIDYCEGLDGLRTQLGTWAHIKGITGTCPI